MSAIDTFYFKRDGINFRASILADESCGTPWDEWDGLGEVSEWTTRAKKPGEIVLCNDSNSYRYYDFYGAVARALRERWRCKGSKGLTKRQVATKAAIEDYKRLRAWCNGDWYWIGIAVDLLDDDGDLIDGHTESLWGIESDASEYHKTVANELADEIIASIRHDLAA